MLAILEPTTLPNEISEKPSKAACKLTINSGAEVEKDTTVNAMIILEIFNLNDKATDERTKNSPPITKAAKPIKTKITFISS